MNGHDENENTEHRKPKTIRRQVAPPYSNITYEQDTSSIQKNNTKKIISVEKYKPNYMLTTTATPNHAVPE